MRVRARATQTNSIIIGRRRRRRRRHEISALGVHIGAVVQSSSDLRRAHARTHTRRPSPPRGNLVRYVLPGNSAAAADDDDDDVEIDLASSRDNVAHPSISVREFARLILPSESHIDHAALDW